MEQNGVTRGEVIVAGLGGSGVKVIGDTLAWATALRYKYVTGVPFYSIAKRGGLSECTIIFAISPLPPETEYSNDLLSGSICG